MEDQPEPLSPASAEAGTNPRRPVSRWTLLALGLVNLGFLLPVWLGLILGDPFERWADPVGTALHAANRILLVLDAAPGKGDFWTRLCLGSEAEQQQVREELRALLAQTTRAPGVSETDLRPLAALAIWDRHAGHTQVFDERYQSLEEDRQWRPLIRALRDPGSQSDVEPGSPDFSAELGPWFTQAWQGPDSASAEAARSLGLKLWRRLERITAAELILTGAGLGLGIYLVLRHRAWLNIPEQPAPWWTLREGLLVFLGGSALGSLVGMLGWVVGEGPGRVLETTGTVLSGLPMVLLVFFRWGGLASGPGLLWLQGSPADHPGRVGRLLLSLGAGLVLFALQDLLNDALHWAGTLAHLHGNFADTVDESLLDAPGWYQGLSAINLTLGAGFFEEFAYRGVLYTSLRRRMGVAGAAGLSSAVFTAMHGYSLLGSIDVFLFGILQAVAVERTRSLIPAIVAHALGNAFAGWNHAALFQ